MQDLNIPYYPKIERGRWEKPQYRELLRREIRYCCRVRP